MAGMRTTLPGVALLLLITGLAGCGSEASPNDDADTGDVGDATGDVEADTEADATDVEDERPR